MKVSEALYYTVDVETTGTSDDARLLEVAARPTWHDGSSSGHEIVETLVFSPLPIPPEASAIHHITQHMTLRAPDLDHVLERVDQAIPEDAVVVAHNAAFDSRFLPTLNSRRWLCTMRLAQHLWPDAPNHKNQTLRYWLPVYVRGVETHRAGSDTAVTAAILAKALEEYVVQFGDRDVDELIAYAESPVLLRKMWMGKQFGKPMDEVEPGFLQWALRTVENMSSDQIYTIEHALRARGAFVPLRPFAKGSAA